MEVEAKFLVPDGHTLERLMQEPALAGCELAPGERRRDNDVFLDTADRRILAAGCYLRRRETADGVRVTLKQLLSSAEGVLRREELEASVSADASPGEWPGGELRARVEELTAGQPLERLLAIAQERVARRVESDGREVAELSLDEVFVSAIEGAAGHWFEAEIETRGAGDDNDLERLAGALRDEWGLVPEGRAKFARALESLESAAAGGALDPVEDACVKATDTMVQAAQKTLALHFARMLAHEAGTCLGEDPEDLHDMRVATRRMRMALRVFGPYLDEHTMRPVLNGLRRTGRTLGAVRDLDVFYEKTRAYLETLPGERRGELDGLLAAWCRERDAQRERLVAYLDGDRYRRFVERFTELLAAPPERLAAASAGLRPERVAEVLPGLLYTNMGVVWAFEGQLDGVETPLPRFHALRKACKGLRYTLEFFDDVLGPGARPLVKTVKRLQDHLGDLQDAVVTSGILRDYLTWGTWRNEAHRLAEPTEVIIAPGPARYLAARQEEMERLVQDFPEVWPRLAGEEFRRDLAAVIATI